MLSLMAKTPRKNAPRATEPEAAQPAASTLPISYKPSARVEAAMKAYIGGFEFPPSKSAVIERALTEFFEKKGLIASVEKADEMRRQNGK